MSQPNQLQPEDDDDRLHREAAELLGKVAHGERAAFSELYDRMSGALFALCISMLEDRAEAEDTLQEVFLIVWSRASQYDPALGKPVSWLMTVARNKCLDKIRSLKRKRTGLQKAEEEIKTSQAGERDANVLASRDKRESLRRALAQLPENQRQVIELAFIKGFTQTEIAEHLGDPIGTVKARIRRGMLKMRDLLDRESKPSDSDAGGAARENESDRP